MAGLWQRSLWRRLSPACPSPESVALGPVTHTARCTVVTIKKVREGGWPWQLWLPGARPLLLPPPRTSLQLSSIFNQRWFVASNRFPQELGERENQRKRKLFLQSSFPGIKSKIAKIANIYKDPACRQPPQQDLAAFSSPQRSPGRSLPGPPALGRLSPEPGKRQPSRPGARTALHPSSGICPRPDR